MSPTTSRRAFVESSSAVYQRWRYRPPYDCMVCIPRRATPSAPGGRVAGSRMQRIASPAVGGNRSREASSYGRSGQGFGHAALTSVATSPHPTRDETSSPTQRSSVSSTERSRLARTATTGRANSLTSAHVLESRSSASIQLRSCVSSSSERATRNSIARFVTRGHRRTRARRTTRSIRRG